MSAAKDLNNAYAKLRQAQNELEQTLQDLGIDPYHFEIRMDEVQGVIELWISELDEGVEPQNLEQEFMFDRS